MNPKILFSYLNQTPSWAPPGPTDLRAPCPLLNSLANHGYLPHDGANISVSDLTTALDMALNIDDTARWLFQQQGNKALTVSSTGHPSTFHLADLRHHDLIEHDGSLSRRDMAQGDNWSFDEHVFNQTKMYWSDTISLAEAARALYQRQEIQKVVNPEYDLPLSQHTNAIGQTAMYLGLFGDYDKGNANKSWVVYLFENERLPFELGWTRRSDEHRISAVGILGLTSEVATHYLGVRLGLI